MKIRQKIFLFFLFTLLSSHSQARILEKIQAVVNGEIVTLMDIREYRNKLKNGGFLDELLFSEPEVKKKALKDSDELLKLLVDEKIIDFEVKRQNLLVTEEKVNKEIAMIARRQNLTPSRLRETLKKQSVPYED